MPNIGWTELIIVIFLVLLLFGANKLPDLARSMGRSARIFKSEVKEMRNDDEQRIENEVVSAHLRSLQAGHLIDVVSTDQHTVKPWFNGKLDVSPPVIDLTAQGFTLIGGRLDYVNAREIGAVVYKRRQHVINLFVAQTASTERKTAKVSTLQGFNIRRWSDRGLNYWAVSDLGADELTEFGDKFESAMRANKEG